MTIQELGQEILKIKEAANLIEVKGERNAGYIVFIHNKCNELIETFNAILQSAQEEPPSNPREEEEGEIIEPY